MHEMLPASINMKALVHYIVHLAFLCLLLMAARPVEAFYDANLGRWLNRDPIEEADGPNLYSYVYNSPVHFVDPFGLQSAAGTLVAEPTLLMSEEAIAAYNAARLAKLAKTAAEIAAKCLAAKCAKEWLEARQWCREVLAKPKYKQSPTGTGGYTDIEKCAKGRVSAECGGNPVAPKPPPTRRPPFHEK